MSYTDGFRSLKVYNKTNELVILIYKLTKNFPKTETFGLISQMRRAAISVVANIIEGWARNSNKEKIQFYHIARGSLTEIEYYIDLSLELKYITSEEHKQLKEIHTDSAKLLCGLIRSRK